MKANEYKRLEKQLESELSVFDTKWNAIDKLNAAWDSLSEKEKQKVTGITPGSYEKNVHPDKEDRVIEASGDTKVYARDVLQPYEDGKPNQKFMDRYGDGIYQGKPSQLDGTGKKPNGKMIL